MKAFVLSRWKRLLGVFLTGVAISLLATMPLGQSPGDPELRVLITGLGTGTVTADPVPPSTTPGISCGTDCTENYAGTDTVTLRASIIGSSQFAGWDGDCATTTPATGPCTLPMTSVRFVRARFDPAPEIPQLTPFNTTTGAPSTRGRLGPADFLDSDEVIRPEDIATYLSANPSVDTAPEFLAALPPEFKLNWILMSRSESLQTGTADSPRILLPSSDARFVFTIGMTPHSSYPGSSPLAIEYMQWDAEQKNFRFHEIILGHIDEVRAINPDGTPTTRADGSPLITVPTRDRRVSADDEKCSKCHSTRNVLNVIRPITTSPPIPGPTPGTDGIPAGIVPAKNKPNWDTYDSWGGAMPFNRDRIYQGSLEAAVFRKFFNPWTWSANPLVRSIIEQLELQPAGVPMNDEISRWAGGPNDGQIVFRFDPSPPVTVEPSPSPAATPDPPVTSNYRFDGVNRTDAGSPVIRGGRFVTLHHSRTPSFPEGRAVQFFDLLGGADGNLNQLRIADELRRHRFATGSIPLDARPIALAIARCLRRDNMTTVLTPAVLDFFTSRHGMMTFNDVFNDTDARARTIPRRKADIQKRNLDRTGDVYLDLLPTTLSDQIGLIPRYGANTAQGATDTSLERVRQEAFRRPIDTPSPDTSEIGGGIYVDREDYAFNTERVALYRYFLEPLGVSVDKWSMGVRGRSRTYTFADVFDDPPYIETLVAELETSLSDPADRFPGLTPTSTTRLMRFDCGALNTAVNNSFTSATMHLPPATGAGAIPKYTDVQRIFNKSCAECHGGLAYPPFNRFFDASYLDLSENEDPTRGNRTDSPHRYAMDFTSASIDPATGEVDPMRSRIYARIVRDNEDCTPTGFTGMMPCGGPKLSKVDIETIKRWIIGGRLYTHGDPHLRTIDGTNYDFQSAGEFVLLRGENLEIQTRQTAVETEAPLGPNEHTGLSSCVSINTAVAIRVGPHRITLQPDLNGRPNPNGLQLRVDGNLVERLGERGMALSSGGRILPTPAPGGIQIQFPGGTEIIITPALWDYRQTWHLNIDVRHARATDGLMGSIAPGNWLPALPDGTFLGPRPDELSLRYRDLYERFADAWRVTDATSLFHYATGISTSTYTIDAWPGFSPQRCELPKQIEGGAPVKPPQKTLPIETARQQCAALVQADLRTNCENDVMVTGEVAFAKSYLLTEQIMRNALPAPPTLLFPEDDKIDLDSAINFTWQKTADAEGDGLTYMHCIWPAGQFHTFNQCTDLPKQMGMFAGLSNLGRCGWVLLLLIILLVVLVVLYVRRGQIVLLVLAIVVLVAIFLVFYFCRPRDMFRSVSALQPGKAYYWKVVVDDGKGGTVESETRRFAVKR